MTRDEMLRELIDLGTELEAIDYNAGKFGAYGFDYSDAKKKNDRARELIAKLQAEGIDPYATDYDYVDDDGNNWDLDYAMQFIGIGEHEEDEDEFDEFDGEEAEDE